MKTVLFDLDGTLLPMDTDLFTRLYFQALTEKAAPCGFEPQALIDGVWAATRAMVKNDGSRTNEEVFWEAFAGIFGDDSSRPVFDDFYRNEFGKAQPATHMNPDVPQLIAWLKQRGVRIAVATNPIFPASGILRRFAWAGLDPADFEYITTYENSRRCKPNPAYYADVCRRLQADPADCLMVGNDADEDTPAAQLGMDVFLITDCLLNRSGRDISAFPHGTFADLKRYLEERIG